METKFRHAKILENNIRKRGLTPDTILLQGAICIEITEVRPFNEHMFIRFICEINRTIVLTKNEQYVYTEDKGLVRFLNSNDFGIPAGVREYRKSYIKAKALLEKTGGNKEQ